MKINIEAIVIAHFQISEDLSNLAGRRITYDISLNNRVTANEKHDDVILCEVDVKLTEPESGKNLVSLKCQNFYHIESLSELVIQNADNTVDLPPKILELIGQLSIGTVRGILFVKLNDTVLGKMLLPILEVSEIEI